MNCATTNAFFLCDTIIQKWYKFVGWVKFADPADYNVYVALPSEKDINFGWKQYESLRKHSE